LPVQAGVEETEITLVVDREENSRNFQFREQEVAAVPPEDDWVGEESRGIARDIPRSGSVKWRRRGNRARLPRAVEEVAATKKSKAAKRKQMKRKAQQKKKAFEVVIAVALEEQEEGGNQECPTAVAAALVEEEEEEDEEEEEEEDENECSVCLDVIDSSDEARALLCGHRYHASCLLYWVEKCTSKCVESTCPYCRSPLQEVKQE
jgi:L-lysine 2,3-aminomutase